jgi:two-component system response regulator AtoC
MNRRVILVDDDEDVRTSLAEALGEGDYEVEIASSVEEALRLLDRGAPDVVLSDVRMPGVDGLELLRLLRERAPQADVILMTAYDDMPTVVRAMRGGAVEFLVKPLDLHELRDLLNRVMADRRARRVRPAATMPTIPGQLVGRDPRMIEVYKTIGQVAATRATVLVRGESGTGKELVARAIHANSASAGEPFVAVNCTALPGGLLESELFGHVRGAFTGAVASRRGAFALAGRGTIFLDEIGDTSLEFQSKLLRVLQDREFRPVGAERAEHAEARVVAATHRNLEALVEQQAFREDLYYRLHVVEIVLPPLRERAKDIPLLAAHLVAIAAAALETQEPVLSAEALNRLMHHPWSGNVRELENCLTRAVVQASGGIIRPEHLALATPPAPAEIGKLRTLDEVERDHVARVLEAVGGHKGRAAEALGVSRPRLNRLMAKHRLG